MPLAFPLLRRRPRLRVQKARQHLVRPREVAQPVLPLALQLHQVARHRGQALREHHRDMQRRVGMGPQKGHGIRDLTKPALRPHPHRGDVGMVQQGVHLPANQLQLQFMHGQAGRAGAQQAGLEEALCAQREDRQAPVPVGRT